VAELTVYRTDTDRRWGRHFLETVIRLNN